MYYYWIKINQKRVKLVSWKTTENFIHHFFQQHQISVSRHLKILEINCSLMINYSKTENSRPFNGKNGAKILAIAKKGDFTTREITPSWFLANNSQISDGNFLWNGLTFNTIEQYFRYEKEPYFAWNNQLPTEHFRLEYQLGTWNIGSLRGTVHKFLHSKLNLNQPILQ